MAWDNDKHKKLKDVAAYLWPDGRDCRRLVADSEIDDTRINWDEPPNLRWQSVIMEAEKQNTLHKLVPVLLREYSGNAQLIEACRPWMSPPAAPIAKKKEVVAHVVKPEEIEELPVTLESIRADLTIISRELDELKRWRMALSTMSANSSIKEPK